MRGFRGPASTTRRLLVIGVPASALILLFTAGASARQSNVAASKVFQACTSTTVPAFTASQLTASSGADYVTHNGTLGGLKNSSLTQITPANASQLTVASHTSLPGPPTTSAEPGTKGVATPLSCGGILYTEDGWDRVYATNAATGQIVWSWDPMTAPAAVTSDVNPLNVLAAGYSRTGSVIAQHVSGLAIGDGMVLIAQMNATVTALNAATGQELWTNRIASQFYGFQFSAAPLYYNGVLYTGTSGGDSGANCIEIAIDAKTGKVLWHWNAVPTEPGQLGFDTWPPLDKRAWIGGDALWSTQTIDPSLGMLYVTTGNSDPQTAVVRLPGAEVPSESIVALSLTTGKPVWVYQEIHHDGWDWDAAQPAQVIDFKYNGVMRQGLMEVGKSGYVYVLDRTTGKPILPIPEVAVPQSAEDNSYATQPEPSGGAGEIIPHAVDPAPWVGFVGPDGNPVRVGTDPYTPVDSNQYTILWQPNVDVTATYAYSSLTGDLYDGMSASEVIKDSNNPSTILKNMAYTNQTPLRGLGSALSYNTAASTGTPAATTAQSFEFAFNPSLNKVMWKVNYDDSSGNPLPGDGSLGTVTGSQSTDSGLLIVGRSKGYVEAYNDKTGALLWTSPQMAAATNSPPMVFQTSDGKEAIGMYAEAAWNPGIAPAGAKGNGNDLYVYELP